MPIVTASQVRVAHGTDVVLDGATFALEPGERVGMVGRNGCGKSTLMKLMAGIMQPDAGTISLQRGVRVGYLQQEPTFEKGDTLRHAAGRAFEKAERAKEALDVLFHDMATAEGAELDRLLKRQVVLEGEIESGGGWVVQHRIDAVLHGLGFTDAQFTIPVEGLSGGQRARLGLARLLLDSPDAILLDEPTNHLDIEGCRWLEGFLSDEFPGAVVVVSHDRWLLDRVVTRIVEIHDGRTREYPGNYEAFVNLRSERHLTQLRQHEKQMDRVRAEKQYIARYKAGQRAKQARGRATRLERYVRDEIVERPGELDALRIELPRAPSMGDVAVAAHAVSKQLGERVLFNELDLSLAPGDRVGIIGPTGAGKTTLVRVLLGELEPDAGILKCSPRLRAGWFRQVPAHLEPSLTVWEQLQRLVPERPNGLKLNEQEARNLAGAFLFSGREQEKAIGNLSGGEKARLVIASLIAGGNNLLVLDEPTNHLDIPSTERLEDALSLSAEEGGFDGALILISHDRALLESTCERLVVLDGLGGARIFDGTYSEWEERGKRPEAPPATPRSPAKPVPARQAPPANESRPRTARQKGNPLSHLSDAEIEAKVADFTAQVESIDAELVKGEIARDRARFDRLLAKRQKCEESRAVHEAEWLRRAE